MSDKPVTRSESVLLDFEGFRVSKRACADYRKSLCEHHKTVADEDTRMIECSDCEKKIDPFEFLMQWARRVHASYRETHAAATSAARLVYLLDWLDSIRGQLVIEGTRITAKAAYRVGPDGKFKGHASFDYVGTKAVLSATSWARSKSTEGRMVEALERLDAKFRKMSAAVAAPESEPERAS